MKTLYFSLTDTSDISQLSELLASFQYYGVKYEIEKDGNNIIVRLK